MMEGFNIDNYLENLLPPATRQDEVNYVKIALGIFITKSVTATFMLAKKKAATNFAQAASSCTL